MSEIPAAWTTAPRSSMPSRSAASWSRSVVSQAAKETTSPSSAASSAAPGASAPRPTRTIRSAPSAASQRARCPPSAPVPPVTRTVPLGDQVPGRGAPARTNRLPNVPVARIDTWSSSPARAATSRVSACSSAGPSMSTSPPQRCGCSTAAPKPRPQIAAWRGFACQAPWVTHQMRASESRRSRATTVSGSGSTASTAVTPSSGSVTTRAPCAVRAAAYAPAAPRTSQVPDTSARRSRSGVHETL